MSFQEDEAAPLPDVIAHADWSSRPAGRWMALAKRHAGGRYHVLAPRPAGDPSSLVERLGGSGLFLGLDLPIGVPSAWARRAGVGDFRALLPALGCGRFERFFEPAATADQIRLERPFYPARPGHARRAQLVERLGLHGARDLQRTCDLAHPGRPAAAALFWTLGPKQVGKAAISAWRDLLQPAIRGGDLALWPFDGGLTDLLRRRPATVAEVYPAELQGRLGIRLGRAGAGSKRRVEDRARAAPALLDAAARLDLDLAAALRRMIAAGFDGPAGEDRFDCVIGLMSMLLVLRGQAPEAAPAFREIAVEGWILGRPT